MDEDNSADLAEELALLLRNEHGFENADASEANKALYATLKHYVPDDADSAILDRAGATPWIVAVSDTHAHLIEVVEPADETETVSVHWRPYLLDPARCRVQATIEGAAWRSPTWRVWIGRDVEVVIKTALASRSEGRRRQDLARRMLGALDYQAPLP